MTFHSPEEKMNRQRMLARLSSLLLSCGIITYVSQAATADPSLSLRAEMKKVIHSLDQPAFSQVGKIGDYDLSIFVDSTIFSPHGKAEVIARIENKTGHTVNLSDLRAVGFNLSKLRKGAEHALPSEHFSSAFQLSEGEIKSGEFLEFKVNIANLSWYDVRSSIYDWTVVRNMFEIVPSGDYYLTMDLRFPSEDSTKELPLSISIESNEILVTLNKDR
jgi:hypothetical protein